MLKTCDINIRDPFVLLHNGTYCMYGTRGATCWGAASGFDVYTSTDLDTWEGPFVCFENDGSFWADRNYWAPEVHMWNSAFYMFASFKNETRCRGTAILKADSPLGPFAPWSDGPVTPEDWECLDGTFYADKAGKPYMVFCHEWVQVGDGEVCALPLKDDLSAPDGEPRLLFKASQADWVRTVHHSSGMKGFVTDGPFMWRDKAGRLLCLWSSLSASGYTQGLAVSDNGEIDGHFTQLEPLFTGDGGHGMLFKTACGKTLLTLHSPNSHLNERPLFLPAPEFL
ncbi:MAG: glycoside hydrolase family 43 protein [Clostridiales bacterium]|nr:glycoside hydrolase family 43 protein [Clostridiales bacterium]